MEDILLAPMQYSYLTPETYQAFLHRTEVERSKREVIARQAIRDYLSIAKAASNASEG